MIVCEDTGRIAQHGECPEHHGDGCLMDVSAMRGVLKENTCLRVHVGEAEKTIRNLGKESLQDQEKLHNLRKEIDMWANYAFKHHGNDAGLYNGLKDLARKE